MFSNDLDRVRHPLASRSEGIILGSIIMVAVAAALVSARTVPFLFAATLAGFLIAAAMRGRLGVAVPRRGPVFWHLAVFLLYAALSTTWALAPTSALPMVLFAMLVAFATYALMQLLGEQPRPNLLHMGEGVWVGFVVAMLYLLIELLTDQSIKIWLFNALGLQPGDLKSGGYFVWSGAKLVAISRDDLTRNMAPLTIFLWPTVMAIVGTLERREAAFVAIPTVVVGSAVVLLSEHETSKLAFFCGLAVFACAQLVPRLTVRALAAGWVIACLAMLPAALLAHRLDLQAASWLQASARHRIIIWNYTAEQVLYAPWLGIGARSTYVLGPLLEEKGLVQPEEGMRRTLSVHSHSVYLQTWFELGLVGATLLTLLGLSVLQAINGLARQFQPYVFATFATAAVMGASSYGMWQSWFVGMFGFAASLVGLGMSLLLARGRSS